MPQLSLETQAIIRISYGILMLCVLLMALPHWKRFFVSDRFAGYAKSSPLVDITHHPVSSFCIGVVWFGCAVALMVGQYTLPAAFINLLICRHFFIAMRWQGVLRGMGAPGFMSYWLAAAVFIVELTSAYAPQYRPLSVLVLQCDYAFIMLSAGIYKFTAGYAHNYGMELGMVNPEWGYWWKFFKQVPPSSLIFKTLNHLAWGTEVVAAVLMLIPPTRFIGGMLMLLSFIFIATQIRLGVLCEMVIVGSFLFFHPGSFGDQLCTAFFPNGIAITTAPHAAANSLASGAIGAALLAYLIAMPLAHAGLFYNFYGRRQLPGILQPCLEKFTNFFGMIIWRVFSVDVINFFIRVYVQDPRGQRTLYSRYGWQGGLRYDHVGECITITCLFTTLKYYASNAALFNERLLRYARTVPCPAGHTLIFEYISIRKQDKGFDFVPAAEYEVDPITGKITERILDPAISVHAAHAVSPVHEGVRPGTYIPSGA
jgi:hypothetical protein